MCELWSLNTRLNYSQKDFIYTINDIYSQYSLKSKLKKKEHQLSVSLKKLIKYHYVRNISLFTFFLQLVKESSQLFFNTFL